MHGEYIRSIGDYRDQFRRHQELNEKTNEEALEELEKSVAARRRTK